MNEEENHKKIVKNYKRRRELQIKPSSIPSRAPLQIVTIRLPKDSLQCQQESTPEMNIDPIPFQSVREALVRDADLRDVSNDKSNDIHSFINPICYNTIDNPNDNYPTIPHALLSTQTR